MELGTALIIVTGSPAVISGYSKPTTPGDDPTPTPQQLIDSVRLVDSQSSITAVNFDGSVVVRDVSGAVKSLATTTTVGPQTVVTLDTDILFDFASADLSSTAAARIGDVVAPVPSAALIKVVGHTDSIGDDAFNLDLSLRRAQAVAAAVATNRPDLVLDVQGRGEAEPVVPNTIGGEDDPSGREQNRRVELRYTP